MFIEIATCPMAKHQHSSIHRIGPSTQHIGCVHSLRSDTGNMDDWIDTLGDTRSLATRKRSTAANATHAGEEPITSSDDPELVIVTEATTRQGRGDHEKQRRGRPARMARARQRLELESQRGVGLHSIKK